MINRVLFAPTGLLALAPHAYGMAYDVALAVDGRPISCISSRGDVAIVSVRGPLVQHPDGCFRSYNEIQCDVEAVLAAKPKAVVLAISSPGGLVAGCFELAATLRTLAAAAGVPLIAYVDGQACSAAYALACGCSRIVAPATADVGSIGVISGLVDATKQAAMSGIRFVVVASGARKSDGNPMSEITPEAIAAKQAHVDEVAELFFEHVSAARGISTGKVRALEGAFFTGAKAQGLHLVDEVQSLDQLLASLNQPASATQATAAEEKPMSVKATLQAVIDDEKASAEDKEDAKKALAAIDDGEDDKASDDDKEEDKASEDGEDDKASEDDDKPADKATATAAKGPPGTAAVASSPLEARLAQVEARLATGEANAKRKKLMAARPDLSAAQRKALASVPVSALAASLAAIPVPKTPAGLTQAAVAGVQTAPGATPTGANATFDEKRAKQRQRMGLAAVTQEAPLVTENGTTKFSVVTAVAAGKVGAR
jgi:signal peptide peptidase SppA